LKGCTCTLLFQTLIDVWIEPDPIRFILDY